MLFIDREEELRALEEAWSSGTAQMVLIYGRRRIGKTYLISRFLREKGGVYLCANHEERELALRDLTEQLQAQVKLPYTPRVSNFRELFELFVAAGARVVVIDEFQRLLKAGGLTELQHAWDQKLSRSRILLLLSGSAVGVAERVGLSHASPLFGRVTRALKVSELSYRAVRAFLPSYLEGDRVRAYGVFGGVPGYLALLNSQLPLEENIAKLALKPGAPLREEPVILLKLELRNPSRYVEILRAIAGGATQFGEIADKSGIKATELPKYLRVLEEDLGLVERRYPLLSEGSRGRVRYYVRDSFTRFWFRFVYPNMVLLELGLYLDVASKLPEALERQASEAFEEVARQHLALLAKRGTMSFTRMGRWWSSDVEIDLVAIDEQKGIVYFIEVKWSKHPIGREVLRRLERKAEEFPWKRNERKEVYVLYSRSGFAFEPEENVLLFSLGDVERDFKREETLVAEL